MDINSSIEYRSFVDVLDERCQKQPDQLAYGFLSRGETLTHTLSYAQIHHQAKQLATVLLQKCQPGDRALLLFPDGLEFIYSFYACLIAGIIAVPTFTPRANRPVDKTAKIARNADVKLILSTGTIQHSLEAIFAQHEYLKSIDWLAVDQCPEQSAAAITWPKINADDIAFLQYTSGSTSDPKGVQISHRNLLANQAMIKHDFQHSSSSVMVGWLPLFHDMGLIGNVLQPMYVGYPVYLMSPLAFLQKPVRWLQAISQYRATTSGAPDFAYKYCAEKINDNQLSGIDLSSWRVAFNGAEPVKANTLSTFYNNFSAIGFAEKAFYPCYGMAEATLFICGADVDEKPRTIQAERAELQLGTNVRAYETSDAPTQTVLVSSGRLHSDENLLIVNPETFEPADNGTIGEIWIYGQHVSSGYWNNPNANSDFHNAYLATDKKRQKAYFRTGDLGCSINHQLYVTGRVKELIIVNGQNHYPHDLLDTVKQSNQALYSGNGAVFSFADKDQENIVVLHEVKPKQAYNFPQLISDICQQVSQVHGLTLHDIILTKPGSIPKTSSGKIKLHSCKKDYLENTLPIIWRDAQNPALTRNR